MSFFIHPPRGDVRNLIIIFGDQLDRDATVLQEIDKKRDAVLMMEVAGESREVPSHKQRTVLFLSAMREVLDGKSSGFTYAYPCASSDGKSWYQLRMELNKVGRKRTVLAIHRKLDAPLEDE